MSLVRIKARGVDAKGEVTFAYVTSLGIPDCEDLETIEFTYTGDQFDADIFDLNRDRDKIAAIGARLLTTHQCDDLGEDEFNVIGGEIERVSE